MAIGTLDKGVVYLIVTYDGELLTKGEKKVVDPYEGALVKVGFNVAIEVCYKF